MPVAAAAMLNFVPGSAVLPSAPAGLIAWARTATSDPRVTLKIAGSVEGSAADVDPATVNGAVLAADHARAVDAGLAGPRVDPGLSMICTASPTLGPGKSEALSLVYRIRRSRSSGRNEIE